jgi:hypothetical protein
MRCVRRMNGSDKIAIARVVPEITVGAKIQAKHE